MHIFRKLTTRFKRKKVFFYQLFRVFLSFWLVISNFLFGFPIDHFFTNPVVVQQASANSNTYDFSDCSTTCDTDTGWYASGDDVDQFPFGGVTANRNTHTEVADADYSNLATSNDGRYSPTNPGSGDENFMWFEMTVTEAAATIGQLDFTFEGSTATTASPFVIYVKTAAGAYETDASWVKLGEPTTIAAGTETTITRSLKGDVTSYFDSNKKIVWGVYQTTSALTLSVDYVKMDVISTQVEQEGYRFRNDDGNETGATWMAAQDTPIYQEQSTNTRLRTLINATNVHDPDTSQYQLEYKLSSDSTYASVDPAPPDVTPTIQTTSSGASTAVNATTHAITMPSGITAGDLLIIVFSSDGSVDAQITAGDWIKLDEEKNGGNVTAAVFYKFAVGGDTATVTTATEQTSHVVYRISGAGVPLIAAANGDSTNSNPPDLDTGISKNYLWIATASHDSTVVASGAPASYSNLITQAAAGTGGASTSTASRAATGSSENPGTFTSNTEQWASFTISVPASNVGIRAAGATAQGTTSVVVPYPRGISAGDLVVMSIANKHSGSTPTTPTGWTAASGYLGTGGSGSDALDTGTVNVAIFYKIADGTEVGDLTVTVTSGSVSIGRMLLYRKELGKKWSVAFVNGADNSAGTDWSVTAGSDPGILAGDIIFAASAINTDAYIFSAQAVTASGVTFTTSKGELYEQRSTNGNDAALILSSHYAVSGTSSAAPVYTMTASGTTTSVPTGATTLMRIRQTTAPIMLAGSSNISASGDNTTALLTAPSGKTTGDFVTGRMQDDENPADTINLTGTTYTELEWNMQATTTAVDAEVYQFRVTVSGVPIGTYSVTPQWTIGTEAAADADLKHYRWRNDDGGEGTPPGAGWYDSNWGYRKKITIDAAQVAGSADLTDFPVLISMTSNDLKDTGNSGHVGQTDGGDILFTNAAGTKLNHEIERYVNTTGELVAWVEVSTLDYDNNTELYIYYGYAGATDQWSVSATWDGTNYAAVFHMNQDPSGSAPQMKDSDSNTNTGTSAGTMTSGDLVTGKIGQALDFDNSNDSIAFSDVQSGNNLTTSAWVNLRTRAGSEDWDTLIARQDGGSWYEWHIYASASDNATTQSAPVFGVDGDDDGVLDATDQTEDSTVLNTSTWYYITGTFDGTTLRIYRNGSQVDSTTCTGCTIPDTNQNIWIGGNSEWGEYFDGQIDEVRVSNAVHGADWIATEYNNQNNPAVGGFLSSIDDEEINATGATWEEDEDTAITDVPKLTNYRVRFLISNEGGATTGAQTYQLEVAETGTCSSGTYAAVPTDTSGDWKISASTHFTDATATTNVTNGLTDENTTFVAGEIKDTGNTTGNITLGTTNFTEIEYSIQATSNATDGGTYCFRVSNVDTYTVYAQATIVAGGSSSFTQSSYRFYVDSNNENVTDPWGNPNIAEDTALTLLPATNVAPIDADEIRLRTAITIADATLAATSQQFKLQYKAGTDANCTTGSWSDVGAGGGGSIWRYATSGVTDGTTLSELKLAVSDVLGVYAKAAPTATNPNQATVGQAIEYDFHLQHNGAATASTYSFRVVESDGTVLSSYTYCPTLTTAQSTNQELRHGGVFSEEVEQGFTRAN